MPPHNKKREMNADKKDFPGCCGTNNVTANDAIAILHHGRYKHAAKLNKAINTMERKNFMLDLTCCYLKKLAFCKLHFPLYAATVRLIGFHQPQWIIFSIDPRVNKCIIE